MQFTLGAFPSDKGTTFRVWAPASSKVDVVVDGVGEFPLLKQDNGDFTGTFPEVTTGCQYKYKLDNGDAFPDPASRFQPEGPFGPSQVVDSSKFQWTDDDWQGISPERIVFYELHVGTFSQEGSYAATTKQLPMLKELGITAIEIMPVAECPGRWNWGYDGVNWFAPTRNYGSPDELRALVNTAHELGMAAILDVVYNHFGPDGNFISQFTPMYFTEKHHTPWGAAVNYDDKESQHVRKFVIENALHWLSEYHFDGLRLDATHEIKDDSPKHILAELNETVRAAIPNRRLYLIAEDDRNEAKLARPISEGGYGLDMIWADGFHHQVRSKLTGEHEGYYIDYSGTMEDLATTIRQGWYFTGQYSKFRDANRGSTTEGMLPRNFVYCLQNHDQIGNRAMGDRLHHAVEKAEYRAGMGLLLTTPATPLLFMGKEWGTEKPFRYFTDHNEELGKLITEGRRKEFEAFSLFADADQQESIPDPQAETSFLGLPPRCGTNGPSPAMSEIWNWTQALLQLRIDEASTVTQRTQRLPSGSDRR